MLMLFPTDFFFSLEIIFFFLKIISKQIKIKTRDIIYSMHPYFFFFLNYLKNHNKKFIFVCVFQFSSILFIIIISIIGKFLM
jgi:hypothetical protein